MKTNALLLTFLGSALSLSVMSQPTVSAPTPPELASSKVISVYSDAYTSVGYSFGEWGSGTTTSEITLASDKIAKFTTTGLGYFGWQFNSTVNAIGMTNLHLDIWADQATEFDFFPITGNPEKSKHVTAEANKWTSVEFTVEEFTNLGLNMGNVTQFKFANVPSKTFYIDNVYFYNSSTEVDTESPAALTASLASASYFNAKLTCSATDNSGAVNFIVKNGPDTVATGGAASGVAATIVVNNLTSNTEYTFDVWASDAEGNTTAASVPVTVNTLATPAPAPAPTATAGNVISIYSDAYTAATGFNVGGWGQSTVATEGTLATGDKAYLCEKFNYLGLELNGNVAAFNASEMEYLHIDVWTSNATTFKITPIWGAEALYSCTPINLNQWNSFNIPLTAFNGINLANIYQIKMEAAPSGSALLFFDNLYLYKEDTGSALNNATTNIKIGTTQNQITISGVENEAISIYTVLGNCIYMNDNTNKDVTINVPTNSIYLVKVGANTTKVLVK